MDFFPRGSSDPESNPFKETYLNSITLSRTGIPFRKKIYGGSGWATKSVQVLLGIVCCVRREALHLVCILLNFTVPFNSLSYLQLLKVCFTNFDRENQKLHGGLNRPTTISLQTQIFLTLQQQSSDTQLLFCCKTECQEFNESSLRITKYVNIQRGQKKLCTCTVQHKLHSLLDLWVNNPQS